MGSKLSVQPDSLLAGNVEKPTFDLRRLLSRSSGGRTATLSLSVASLSIVSENYHLTSDKLYCYFVNGPTQFTL